METENKKKPLWTRIKKSIRCWKEKLFKDKRVGLLRVEGIIMDSPKFPLVKKIEKALEEVEDKDIKALVLRVNSPGGTVGASQEIYDAIKKVREKGVKVVASFGDVSASGGLYIGCSAEKIMANPGTITGSIGVIIHSANIKKLYDKIGIEAEVVKSGPYKDILSSHRALTEEERKILQDMVGNTYEQFVRVVSESRNIPEERVKEFADGRIFNGEQALEIGVIDKLGTLQEAIEYAAELAGIEEEPEIEDLSPKKSFWGQIFGGELENLEIMVGYSGIPLWLMPRNL